MPYSSFASKSGFSIMLCFNKREFEWFTGLNLGVVVILQGEGWEANS